MINHVPQFSNAIPAAEAALEIAMSRTDKTLANSRCLLLGCGRIGRVLARELAQIGAEVHTYDVIFNTIPEKVLSDDICERISKDTLVLDLASVPGGGIPNSTSALGLPSKHSPETAAQIMKDAVIRISKSRPIAVQAFEADDDLLADPENANKNAEGFANSRPKIGFALTGSFCTIPAVLPVIEELATKADVFPIVSETVALTSTRFGAAHELLSRLEEVCGNAVIKTVFEAEPIGPKNFLDALVIAPTTGNTLAKLANGIADTAVTMATKAHLRNGKPLIIAPSTNDGLGNAAKNIGQLLNMKNVYFVPFGQDDCIKKPRSLVAEADKIIPTIAAALKGEQLQPIIF